MARSAAIAAVALALVACVSAAPAFVSIGDWGGAALEDYHKTDELAVAKQFGVTAEQLNAEFVVNVGDNFCASRDVPRMARYLPVLTGDVSFVLLVACHYHDLCLYRFPTQTVRGEVAGCGHRTVVAGAVTLSQCAHCTLCSRVVVCVGQLNPTCRDPYRYDSRCAIRLYVACGVCGCVFGPAADVACNVQTASGTRVTASSTRTSRMCTPNKR